MMLHPEINLLGKAMSSDYKIITSSSVIKKKIKEKIKPPLIMYDAAFYFSSHICPINLVILNLGRPKEFLGYLA